MLFRRYSSSDILNLTTNHSFRLNIEFKKKLILNNTVLLILLNEKY